MLPKQVSKQIFRQGRDEVSNVANVVRGYPLNRFVVHFDLCRIHVGASVCSGRKDR